MSEVDHIWRQFDRKVEADNPWLQPDQDVLGHVLTHIEDRRRPSIFWFILFGVVVALVFVVYFIIFSDHTTRPESHLIEESPSRTPLNTTLPKGHMEQTFPSLELSKELHADFSSKHNILKKESLKVIDPEHGFINSTAINKAHSENQEVGVFDNKYIFYNRLFDRNRLLEKNSFSEYERRISLSPLNEQNNWFIRSERSLYSFLGVALNPYTEEYGMVVGSHYPVHHKDGIEPLPPLAITLLHRDFSIHDNINDQPYLISSTTSDQPFPKWSLQFSYGIISWSDQINNAFHDAVSGAQYFDQSALGRRLGISLNHRIGQRWIGQFGVRSTFVQTSSGHHSTFSWRGNTTQETHNHSVATPYGLLSTRSIIHHDDAASAQDIEADVVTNHRVSMTELSLGIGYHVIQSNQWNLTIDASFGQLAYSSVQNDIDLIHLSKDFVHVGTQPTETLKLNNQFRSVGLGLSIGRSLGRINPILSYRYVHPLNATFELNKLQSHTHRHELTAGLRYQFN